MGSVVKVKSTIKSAFFATNHPDSFRDGAKQKVSETTDFAVILTCNRKSIIDFQVKNGSLRMIVIFLALILINFKLQSQSDYLQTFNTTEGLSQNSVNCAIQTSEGFLWLGTYDGLNRFDGKNFKSYKANVTELDMKVKPSKLINFLFLDDNDLIWVATSNSTILFDRKKNKFYNPEIIYKNFKDKDAVNVVKILQDKNANLFLFTNSKNLSVYNFKEKSIKRILTEGVISDISAGPLGNILIATSQGVFTYQKNQLEKIIHLENESPKRIESDGHKVWIISEKFNLYEYDLKTKTLQDLYKKYILKSILVDPNRVYFGEGKLWIGTRSEGLRKIELSNGIVTTFIAKNNRNSLQSNFILSIQNTSKGITVIGQSGGGFAVHDNVSYGIALYKTENNKFGLSSDNMILSIKKISVNEIAAGTISSGLLITNLETKAFQYYDIPLGDKLRPESKNIYAIEKINNKLYMASWGGLLEFDLSTKKFSLFSNHDRQSKSLYSVLYVPKLNKLLLGSAEGGLLYFNLQSKSFESVLDVNQFLSKHLLSVRFMKAVNENEVWMSTEKAGLVRYEFNTGKFYPFDSLYKQYGTSRHFNIDDNFIWVSTDEGLIQLEKKTFKFVKVWTRSDGMANDFLYSTFTDELGKVWVTSNYGLSIINTKDNSIINLTERHGLQSLEFNTASIDKDDSGKYYIGGTNGFNVIDPNLFEVDQPINPPVITSVSIRNEPKIFDLDVQYKDTIILAYEDNYIDIEFQVSELSRNKNGVFKYKLSNFDKDHVITNRNYVSYSNLKYGIYNFELFSSNLNGNWSAAKKITIVVKTPWYRQWWFLIGRAALVIMLTYFFLKWYINLVNSQVNLEKDYALNLKNLELDNLRSQMNPHFLFNALNSINSFIVKNEVHKASDYLSKFSKLMRMILEHSKKKSVLLSDEIEALELYLKIESNRFEKSFEHSILIDEGILTNEIYIPPLIIQPFVENAIWHGIQHQSNVGLVHVKFSKQGDDFVKIEIVDNGIGREKAKKLKSKSGGGNKSYGINITKERIKYSHPNNSMEIVDLHDQEGNPTGTKVILILHNEEIINNESSDNR